MDIDITQYGFHWFNASDAISQHDINRAIERIDHLIATIEHPPERPTFQTDKTLFDDDVFAVFKRSFIRSCTEALPPSFRKKQFRVGAECSAYVDYWDNYRLKDREAQWHYHKNTYYSGVFYLRIPESMDINLCGTEFRINADLPDTHIQPRPNHWLIFPGQMLHRPGISNTNDKRYVLGAALYLYMD